MISEPDGRTRSLLLQAAKQEQQVRRARDGMGRAVSDRNETIRALRESGASYGEIAKAIGLTRAGAVGICRKIGVA